MNLARVLIKKFLFFLVEKERRVRANDPEYNASFKYAVSFKLYG